MIGEFKLCCYWNALCSHTTLLFLFSFFYLFQGKKPICHPCQLLSTIHSLTWYSLWWSGSLLKSCPWTILFGCGIYALSLSFAKLLPLVCSTGWCGEWSRRMVSLYKRIIGSWFIDNGSRPNTTALCGTCQTAMGWYWSTRGVSCYYLQRYYMDKHCGNKGREYWDRSL